MKKTFHIFSAIIACLALLPAVAGAYTYYMPYYIWGGGNAAGVGLRNLSETSPAVMTVDVYDQTGALAFTTPLNLAANGQTAQVLADTTPREGWIQVTSDQKLAGLCFTAKDNFMMDIPVTEFISKKMVIPHCAQDREWDTIIYAANPNMAAASLTATFYEQSGAPLAQKSYTIAAMGSDQIPLSDILGAQERSAGSIVLESDEGIAAFALYSNMKSGLSFYAGINALALEISNFDGTWIGTASSLVTEDMFGDPCVSQLDVTFEIADRKISGSAEVPDFGVGEFDAEIDLEGKVVWFFSFAGQTAGFVTGQVADGTISGEWQDFTGCYGPWQVAKQ